MGQLLSLPGTLPSGRDRIVWKIDMESSFERTGSSLKTKNFGPSLFQVLDFSLVLFRFAWQFYPVISKLANAQYELGFTIDAPTLRVTHDGMHDLLVGGLQEVGRAADLLNNHRASRDECLGTRPPWQRFHGINRVVGIGQSFFALCWDGIGGRRKLDNAG